jgi:hypothetical protein
MSQAFTERDFLSAMFLIEPRSMMRRSGMREFWEVWTYLRDQRKPARHAAADRGLWSRSGDLPADVTALSPSDQDISVSLDRLVELVKESQSTGPLEFVESQDPNAASVVARVRVGSVNVLLAADLEAATSPDRGWLAVLDTDSWEGSRSEVFKVPHHGSPDADEVRVWEEMLIESPFVVVTPFVFLGTRLPGQEDQRRICSRTDRAFMTALAVPPSVADKYSPPVAEMVEGVTQAFEPFSSEAGHVRLRRNIDLDVPAWTVECFGPAHALRVGTTAA